MMVRRILLCWIEVLKEVAADNTRQCHCEIYWCSSQGQKSTFSSFAREIKREHVNHRCIKCLSHGHNTDKEHEIHDIHTKEHWNRGDGSNYGSYQYQVIRVVLRMHRCKEYQEHYNENGR